MITNSSPHLQLSKKSYTIIHYRMILLVLLIIGKFLYSQQTKGAPPQKHHLKSAVWAVCYSPDGSHFASGGNDNLVKVWNVADMQCKAILRGHNGAVWALAFSPDGKLLASGSCDQTIKIWADNKLIATLKGHTGIVTSIAFSPNGKYLASAGSNRSIRVWSLDTFKQIEINRMHKGCVSSIAFSPDGEHIISGSFDHTVRLWSWHSNTSRIIGSHEDSVVTVAFSPDGRNVATGGYYRTVKIWNFTDNTLRQILSTPDDSIITCITYSPDGSLLTSGTQSGRINIWKVDTIGHYSPVAKHNSYVSTIAFSPDGKRLISGSSDSSFMVWNLPPRQSFYLNGQSMPKGIVSLSSSQHSNPPLLASTFGNNNFSLWSLNNGALLQTIPTVANCSLVVFAHDGTFLAARCDNHLLLYEVSTGKITQLPEKHSKHIIQSVQFSPDNSRIAYLCNNSIFVYSIKQSTLTKIKKNQLLNSKDKQITCMAFPPDTSETVVVGGDSGTINLCSIPHRKIIKKLGNFNSIEKVTSICFTPDDSGYVVTSDEGTLQFRSFPKDILIKEVKEIVAGAGYLCISSDGLYIASKNLNGNITIRSAQDLQLISTLGTDQNQQKFYSMTFSDYNPSLLISGGNDGSICFWDVSRNRCLFTSFLITDNDFIIYDTEGNFNASNRMRSKYIEFGLKKDDFLPSAINSQMTLLNTITTHNTLHGNSNTFIQNGVKNDPLFAKNEGKKYAIIIGISDYKHLTLHTPVYGLTDLKYCDKDAEAFKKFIEDSSRSGGNWEISYLINQNATQINIDTTITSILKYAKKEDLIYIFFSGHARSHKDESDRVYLLSYDFDPVNYRSGFEYGVLMDLIGKSDAGHVVAFIDACKSGTTRGKGENSIASYSIDWLKEKYKQFPPNRIIFTSASNSQVSWEDDDHHMGIFSYYLIKGLNGFASEYKDDTYINVYELAEYVENKVTEHTRNAVLQKPDLLGFRIDDWYPLAIRVRQ